MTLETEMAKAQVEFESDIKKSKTFWKAIELYAIGLIGVIAGGFIVHWLRL